MIAFLLTALFAAIAAASAATLADAAVRSRNAIRLLRGDLARIESLRQVTVRFEGISAAAAMPSLRAAPVSSARSVRQTARTPQRLRAAA